MKPNHLPLPDYDHGHAVNEIEREIKKTRREIILLIFLTLIFTSITLVEIVKLIDLRTHYQTSQTQETNQ